MRIAGVRPGAVAASLFAIAGCAAYHDRPCHYDFDPPEWTRVDAAPDRLVGKVYADAPRWFRNARDVYLVCDGKPGQDGCQGGFQTFVKNAKGDYVEKDAIICTS